MQAGYRLNQLYTDNITRIGHCFSADPLINLIDMQEKNEILDCSVLQLAASVPGDRVSLLLRRATGYE